MALEDIAGTQILEADGCLHTVSVSAYGMLAVRFTYSRVLYAWCVCPL